MIDPIANDGMNSPAGTLIPKVIMVISILKTTASESSHIAVYT